MRKTYLFLTLVILACFALTAGNTQVTYDLEMPELSVNGEYDVVNLKGCQITGLPGSPALPSVGLRALLPQAEEATDINISLENRVLVATGLNIIPVQQEYPLSQTENIEFTNPNPDIYLSASAYPQENTGRIFTQFLKGHSIAFTTITPFEYYPETGELYFFSKVTVNINSNTSQKAQDAQRFFRSDAKTKNSVRQLLDNPSVQESYYNYSQRDIRENEYDYLIITNQALSGNFTEFANYKNRCGIITQIHHVEDILPNYDGVDDAEKIRNFIIEQYTEYGIDYLLLAGDDEILLHRGLYDSQGDDDIPADVYFSGLDGTWNEDEDNLWGEPDEDDLLTELSVGRMAVDTDEEATNFLNKIMMYQIQPVAEDLEKTWMVGEDLGWSVWGKDYKEEVRLGSSEHGYTTIGPDVADNFTNETMYDHDGVWSTSDLWEVLNDGPNLVNHLGHCYWDYMAKLYIPDITLQNSTNNGVDNGYFILYSQGCYPGAFDNRSSSGQYEDDCIGEVWTGLETGPVALIINSRYGWGNNSSTDGSSNYYDRQFFDAIFGEEIYKIGDAQMDSKHDNISFIDHRHNRWCYYCCNLFGDPTMDIWTGQPKIVTATHNEVLFLGMQEHAVNVKDENEAPIQGAIVALSKDNVLIAKGVTDENGDAAVVMLEQLTEPAELDITITGHNVLPYQQTVQMIYPAFVEFSADNIPINTTTQLVLTVTDDQDQPMPGVECWADGIGTEYDTDPVTTDANGECTISILYPYGNKMLISGKLPEEDFNRFTEEITISGGNDYTNPDLIVVNGFNLDDGFVAGIEGEIQIDMPEDGYKLWAYFNGAAPIISDNAPLLFTPDATGKVRVVVTKEDYNMYEEEFDVITAIGKVAGNVTDSESSAAISGITVKFFERNADIETAQPLFTAVTDDDGDYEIAEAYQTAYYDIYIDCFGYNIYYEEDFILGIGNSNIKNIQMTLATPATISGMITDTDSNPLRARVKAYRLDTGELYAQVESDDDGYYQIDVPSFGYTFRVKATGQLQCKENFFIEESQTIDFSLMASQGALIINADMENEYDGAQIIKTALDGLEVNTTIESADETDPNTWMQYEGIVYVCGASSGDEALLSDDDHNYQMDLLDFLDTERSVWIVGSKVGLFHTELFTTFRERIMHEERGGGAYSDIEMEETDHPIAIFPHEIPEVIEFSGESSMDGTRVTCTDDCDRVAEWESAPNRSAINCANNKTVYTSFIIDKITDTTVRTELLQNIGCYLEFALGPRGIEDNHGLRLMTTKNKLFANTPNPFNPVTTLRFQINSSSNVNLSIYNVKGQKIRELINTEMESGMHSVVWNGKNDNNEPVSSGMYFYKIESGDYVETRKMLLIK